MAISLEIEPELQKCLEGIAEARGLTLEGYLLTLLEALATPENPRGNGLRAVLRRIVAKRQESPVPRSVADDAANQIKADLLAQKERAVKALTKANLLRKNVERHQALIAEKELQALSLSRDGSHELALYRFQESCVYGQRLEVALAQCDQALQEADELCSIFKQKEQKVQARLSQLRSLGTEASDNPFGSTLLSEAELQRRVALIASSEEWEGRFCEWTAEIANRSSASEPLPTIEFVPIEVDHDIEPRG